MDDWTASATAASEGVVPHQHQQHGPVQAAEQLGDAARRYVVDNCLARLGRACERIGGDVSRRIEPGIITVLSCELIPNFTEALVVRFRPGIARPFALLDYRA